MSRDYLDRYYTPDDLAERIVSHLWTSGVSSVLEHPARAQLDLRATPDP